MTVSEASDQADFNMSPATFSSLVAAAKAIPEVRSELVDSYKARIHSGHYPSQDIVDGLTKLMGGLLSEVGKSAR